MGLVILRGLRGSGTGSPAECVLQCLGDRSGSAIADGAAVEGVGFEEFRRELFASPEFAAESVGYEGKLPLPAGGERLQVLVQTNGGRVASTTVDVAVSAAVNR